MRKKLVLGISQIAQSRLFRLPSLRDSRGLDLLSVIKINRLAFSRRCEPTKRRTRGMEISARTTDDRFNDPLDLHLIYLTHRAIIVREMVRNTKASFDDALSVVGVRCVIYKHPQWMICSGKFQLHLVVLIRNEIGWIFSCYAWSQLKSQSSERFYKRGNVNGELYHIVRCCRNGSAW